MTFFVNCDSYLLPSCILHQWRLSISLRGVWAKVTRVCKSQMFRIGPMPHVPSHFWLMSLKIAVLLMATSECWCAELNPTIRVCSYFCWYKKDKGRALALAAAHGRRSASCLGLGPPPPPRRAERRHPHLRGPGGGGCSVGRARATGFW